MDPIPSSAAAAGQIVQPGMPRGPEPMLPLGGGRSRDVGAEDAVCTIFITGFPQGVKDRELHNLVRYLPGYEASQMSMRGDQALGFVLFSSHWHACQAQDAIAGTPFEALLPASFAPTTTATAAAPSQPTPPARSTTNAATLLHRRQGSETGAAAGEPPTARAPQLASREPVAAAPSGSAAAAAAVTTALLTASAEGAQHGRKGHPAAEQLAATEGARDVKVTGGALGEGAGEKEEGGTISKHMAAGAPVGSSAAAVAATTVAAAKLSEAAGGAAAPGAGVETHTPVGRHQPVTIRLRCELAHKNLHLKESDPSIHRPHRPLLLLPHPASPYGHAPFPVPTSLPAGLQSPVPISASASIGQVPVPASPSTSLGVKSPPIPTTRSGAPPSKAPSVTAAALVAPSVTQAVPSDVAPTMGGPSDYSWGMAGGADVRLMSPSRKPLGTFLHQSQQVYAQHPEQQYQQQQEQTQPMPLMSPTAIATAHHSQSPSLTYTPASPSSSSGAALPRGRGGMIGLGGSMGFLPVTNRGDNPPCNTLFVGNLSDTVSEVELCQLFSAQAGYRQMKLVRGSKQVSCFVEFDDLISATTVHQALQGAVLATSERGGMRIQFSKNPYGRRTPRVVDPMAAMPPNPMGPFYTSPSWATTPLMPPHHMPHMPPY